MATSVNQPTDVSAVADSGTTITVSWTNAQTDHDNNQVEYRDITGGGSWTVASSAIAPGDTSYQITGLTATTEGKDGDAGPVEAGSTHYTWPDATGYYWVSYIAGATTPSDWTHIMRLTGTAPFFTGFAASPDKQKPTSWELRDATNWEWGPSITKPSYIV